MKQRRANRKLGSIERDVLEELSFGDLMYGFLLSARSTSRMHRLARERAMQRYRRKIAVERLIGAKYIQASGERLSITGKGRLSLGNAVRKNMQSLRNTTALCDTRCAVFWREQVLQCFNRVSGYFLTNAKSLYSSSKASQIYQNIFCTGYSSESRTIHNSENISNCTSYIACSTSWSLKRYIHLKHTSKRDYHAKWAKALLASAMRW